MGRGHLPRLVPGTGRVAMAGPGTLLRHRLQGTYTVDEWGGDEELRDLVGPLGWLRWRIDVQGASNLPGTGPAVVVYGQRLGLSEPFVVAEGLRRESGRSVRPVGIPDVAPAATLLRRLGGVFDRPEEVAGLLDAGLVVAVPLGRVLAPGRRPGDLAPLALAPAVAANTPVVPVATIGRELGRGWRVVVGQPIRAPRSGGPLASAELAESARQAVGVLLSRT